MQKLLNEWREYLAEIEIEPETWEGGIKKGRRPTPQKRKAPIKKVKASSGVKMLKKFLGGTAGVVDKIVDYFGVTSDLRIIFYLEFLKQRKTPLTVKDIPGGQQKFASLAAKFYEPLLNGDLNFPNSAYIKELERFIKTGQFGFGKQIVLALEDFFESPVTGYYGLRGGFFGSSEGDRGGSDAALARFSSNVMTELTNSLGRYSLSWRGSVATINDNYDFDDVNSFFKDLKGKEFNLGDFKKSILQTIKDKVGEKLSLEKIKKANLNQTIYSLMFDVNNIIHAEGYQGYPITLKFPVAVEKARLTANIKKLKLALKEKERAGILDREKKQQADYFASKKHEKERRRGEASPQRKKPYKPTKCIARPPHERACFEYGAKCFDLASNADFPWWDKLPIDFRESDAARAMAEEGGRINYFGAFIVLGLMTPKSALEAQKFIPSICLPMEMYGGSVRGPAGLKDEFVTGAGAKKIFALYKQATKGALEEAKDREVKELFKRLL